MTDRLAETEQYFVRDGRDEHWFSDQEQEHIEWLITEVKRRGQMLDRITSERGQAIQTAREIKAEVERLRRVLDRVDRATSDPTLLDPEARSVVAAWVAEAVLPDAAAPAKPQLTIEGTDV